MKNKNIITIPKNEIFKDFLPLKFFNNVLIQLIEKNITGIYNVGSGENISILEIAKMISNDYVFIPPRSGEAKTTLANIDKIKNVFGWNPKINIKNWVIKNNVSI